MKYEPVQNLVELAAEMTTAWLSNPNTGASAADALAFLDGALRLLRNMDQPVSASPRSEQTDGDLELGAAATKPLSIVHAVPELTHSDTPAKLKYTTPFSLSSPGSITTESELFDNLDEIKERAREMINSGEADLVTISDAEERAVASFQRLVWNDDISRRRFGIGPRQRFEPDSRFNNQNQYD